ncbi:MAG: tRNA-(ms[2]io[6]A)-hydroxylase [Crocinitomicaceae bacterium]|nr:tRNA-(ms[2]io[6]A)-hydroxylase [Crocinitomicaceae bacterium]|tara:strand:+ start:1867 stop:2451 length:585 start_codon:yes stop_codon:yes gene_type:complete
MEFEVELRWKTPQEWVDAVLADLPSFLQDHADCERKASSMAMSFIAKCPDRVEMIPELIEIALEELVHFKLVYEVMDSKGIALPKQLESDNYIAQLIKKCRSGLNERLLDRMVVASIVEARGAERFRMVAENIEDVDLKKFYDMLWKSEFKHSDVFLRLALSYWPRETIHQRLNYFLDEEAIICKSLPFRAALH